LVESAGQLAVGHDGTNAGVVPPAALGAALIHQLGLERHSPVRCAVADVEHGAQWKLGAPGASARGGTQVPFQSRAQFDQRTQVAHAFAGINAVAARTE